jgi:hypothetical protein
MKETTAAKVSGKNNTGNTMKLDEYKKFIYLFGGGDIL